MRIILAGILIFISFYTHSASVYQVFTENGKQGLKDNKGQVIIPPQFEALGWTFAGHEVKNDRIGFLQNGKWGLLNISNEILYPATLEAIYSASGNFIVAGKKQINGRYKKGLIDYEGKMVIPFEYNILKIFDTNLIAVRDKFYGLINFQNKPILPFEFTRIESAGDLRWIAWNIDNKGALFDNEGSVLTDFVIDSIENFQSGVTKAWIEHKAGLLDRSGRWILPADFKNVLIRGENVIGEPYNSYFSFRDENKQLQIDSLKIYSDKIIHVFAGNYQWLVDHDLNRLTPVGSQIKVSDSYAGIKDGQLFKLYDIKNKKWLSENYYQDVDFINKDLVIVKENQAGKKGWSLLDANTLTSIVSGIEKFEAKLSGIKIKRFDYWGFYNYDGEEILSPVYEDIKLIKENRFLVQFHQEQGIINSNGEWLLPPVDQQIQDFTASYYISFDGKNFNLYDFNGKKIYFSYYPLRFKASYVEEHINNAHKRRIGYDGLSIKSVYGHGSYQEVLALKEGLIGIYYQGMYGFIDPQNRLLIANRYDGIQAFNEGIASVKIREKWGAINRSESLIVQPLYDSISYFNSGTAVVRVKDKFGMISSSGEIMLPIEYDSFFALNDKYFLVEKDNFTGVVSAKGNILIWPKYDKISFRHGYFIVSKDDKFGIHDQEGIALLPPVYEKIIPQNNENFLIGRKNEPIEVELH